VTNNIILSRKILYNETWTQALLLPFRLFFEGQDDNHQFFDGKLNPFLLLLPIFAFFRSSSPPSIHQEKQFLLAFSFLFFFFTFFQQVTRVRYIICILPPLVILSTYGLHTLFSKIIAIRSVHFKKALQFCVFSIPLAFIYYNYHYLTQQFQIIQPLSYLTGKVGRDQYISHFRPEYPAIQFVNEHPSATKILAVFLGNRGYYFDKQVQFDLIEGKSLLCETIVQANTNSEALEKLKTSNISHLLIRHDLLKQWIEQQYQEKEVYKLNHFFQNNTQLIYEANGHGVHQLLDNNG
jgi:4-amino-4-deoxy-L-arabinose transferase-like glycosyltransferase